MVTLRHILKINRVKGCLVAPSAANIRLVRTGMMRIVAAPCQEVGIMNETMSVSIGWRCPTTFLCKICSLPQRWHQPDTHGRTEGQRLLRWRYSPKHMLVTRMPALQRSRKRFRATQLRLCGIAPALARTTLWQCGAGRVLRRFAFSSANRPLRTCRQSYMPSRWGWGFGLGCRIPKGMHKANDLSWHLQGYPPRFCKFSNRRFVNAFSLIMIDA